MSRTTRATLIFAIAALSVMGCEQERVEEVRHGYASSGGVDIHYAESGEGPLVVFIHGFPDFWYTWRHQMAGLADRYRVVAIDQRGYNLSGQPEGQAHYDMRFLVADVAAVIEHLGESRAVVVGHDWGGAVAWNVAFRRPELVSRLVVLNLPHPRGLAAAVNRNPELLDGMHYARVFRESHFDSPDVLAGGPMTPLSLASWVTDETARERYIEAFKRSDRAAMLAYYKQNYPDFWGELPVEGPRPPSVSVPTLIVHGLEDRALPAEALNDTWAWVDADLTLVTVPGAGHFVQHDAAEFVTTTLRSWLDARH